MGLCDKFVRKGDLLIVICCAAYKIELSQFIGWLDD